jgi:outer membrane protein assembly factor BamB
MIRYYMAPNRFNFKLSVFLCASAFVFLSCGSFRLSSAPNGAGENWRMFGRDCGHDSMVNIPTTSIENLWKRSLDAGFGYFSPTIVNGIVFVSTLKGDVYMLDAKNGAKIGSKSFGGAIFSGPVISDTLMVLASSQSKKNLLVYQLASGKVIWAKSIGDVESAPTLKGSDLFVATVAGELYEFDLMNVKEIFRKVMTAPIRVSPAVTEGMVVVGCDDGNVYAFSTPVGKELWRYDTGMPVWCSPSIKDSLVLVGTNGGKLLALSRTGELKFDFEAGGKILSMPICDKERIYFGSNDGAFYSLDRNTGKMIWKVQTGAPIIASAVQTSTQVIFGSFDENLYVVEKSSGKIVEKIKLSGRVCTQPAMYDNYLIVGTENSEIYGFKIH